MDEKKKESIQKEAKEILAKFSKTLSSVKLKPKDSKEELGGFREEGEGMKSNEDFRKRMFENAPSKEGDYIVAEKKEW